MTVCGLTAVWRWSAKNARSNGPSGAGAVMARYLAVDERLEPCGGRFEDRGGAGADQTSHVRSPPGRIGLSSGGQ